MKKIHAAPKIAAVFLALFLTVLAVMPVHAGSRRSIIDGYAGGSLYDNFSLGQSGDPHDLVVMSGDEIRIPLTADLFTFSDGKVPINNEAVSSGQLARVHVRTRMRVGSQALDFVQFDSDFFDNKPFIRPGGTAPTGMTSYISVVFAKEFVSVEDVDFDFLVYLVVDGIPYDDKLGIHITGTLCVETETVYKGIDYVDMSNGHVIEATETVNDIRADLGNGLTAQTNMVKDKKYFGVCKILDGRSGYIDELDLLKMDIELPELYPGIAGVYKLQTIGLDRPATIIHIDDKMGNYHVYGEDFAYLGMSTDDLPYSNHYFLTTKRIPEFDAFAQYQETGEE